MKKTGRYIFYVFTIMTCVVILILAIYYSFINKPENVLVINGVEQNIIPVYDIQKTKEEFGNEFNNKFNQGNYDDSAIPKTDPEKGLVYIANSADGESPSFTTGENGDTYTEWCCTIIMLTLCWPVILPTQIVRTIVNNIQRKRRRAEWEHLEKERNNK